MDSEIAELVSKITKLKVPGMRMSRWPEEIKDECMRLLKSGVAINELSKQTGIWTGSLHDWQKKAKSQFKEVRLNFEATKSVQPKPVDKLFTLQFSTGPRIENITFDDLRFFKDCGLI